MLVDKCQFHDDCESKCRTAVRRVPDGKTAFERSPLGRLWLRRPHSAKRVGELEFELIEWRTGYEVRQVHVHRELAEEDVVEASVALPPGIAARKRRSWDHQFGLLPPKRPTRHANRRLRLSSSARSCLCPYVTMFANLLRSHSRHAHARDSHCETA